MKGNCGTPFIQSIDHDPDGSFIRRYCPELKEVSTEFIHGPWLMDSPPLNYPAPIVDHEIVARFAKEQIHQRSHAEGASPEPRRKRTKRKPKQDDHSEQIGMDI